MLTNVYAYTERAKDKYITRATQTSTFTTGLSITTDNDVSDIKLVRGRLFTVPETPTVRLVGS